MPSSAHRVENVLTLSSGYHVVRVAALRVVTAVPKDAPLRQPLLRRQFIHDDVCVHLSAVHVDPTVSEATVLFLLSIADPNPATRWAG